MTSKIAIREVSKTYSSEAGKVLALQATNLHVKEGEFVSLVGPSGCGKSTLLYVVGGFLAADGDVLIDGKAIEGPGVDRGIVFQEYALFPWLTVRRNILYGPRIRNLPAKKCDEIADRLIEVIGLRNFEHRYPRELSGGMARRTSLARMLATGPSTLLLDEPFGALDAQLRGDLQHELLRLWTGSGKTIVFVTHDIDEAMILADRVVVLLWGGRIAIDETVAFARPRDARDVRTAPAFTALHERLHEAIGTDPRQLARSGV
jgi:NitT/TauT family transport system ATP-binding protein